MTTVFKLADKVAAFKAKLELWGRRMNRVILDMFQTLAGILGETEPEHSFSQLVHDHLSLHLKEFERYFPPTKDPRTVMAEYPEIATTALKSLLPFPTSYLCEAGFSAMTATKTKQRNKLDISNTLRVSLSPITPRWNHLIAKKQAQGSH
ncbi:SCAN domain-containing protein 3-like [Tachysurus ichikawai]